MKDFINRINNKQKKIISLAVAVWGLVFIGTGSSLAMTKAPVAKSPTKLRVAQKRVASAKSNEIKLKDMESEINQPISVNVKDYLENPDDIEIKILSSLKLDTSMVNIAQAGTYTYTITYKKKKFSATYVVKEKELPNVNITLKDLNLEVGSSLSKDVQTYINEELTDEVKQNITLDISAVNASQSGSYQYSIKYKNNLYTGTITIYQPNTVPTQITINDTKDKEKEKTE